MNDNITLPREVAYQVPLHELLESVPSDARLVIDDADGKGTRFIPVGRLCREAAAILRTALAAEPTKPVVISKDWLKMTLRVNRGDRVLKVERWLHLSEIKQSRFPLVKATADSAWQELDAAMKEDKT